MIPQRAIAVAVARCEGFYVANSIPARCHNPGDLELGDQGYGMMYQKTIFNTDADGWNALEREFDMIASGESKYYSVDTTLEDFAAIWSGNDPNYARMLAEILHVPGETRLGDILNVQLS